MNDKVNNGADGEKGGLIPRNSVDSYNCPYDTASLAVELTVCKRYCEVEFFWTVSDKRI